MTTRVSEIALAAVARHSGSRKAGRAVAFRHGGKLTVVLSGESERRCDVVAGGPRRHYGINDSLSWEAVHKVCCQWRIVMSMPADLICVTA